MQLSCFRIQRSRNPRDCLIWTWWSNKMLILFLLYKLKKIPNLNLNYLILIKQLKMHIYVTTVDCWLDTINPMRCLISYFKWGNCVVYCLDIVLLYFWQKNQLYIFNDINQMFIIFKFLFISNYIYLISSDNKS